MAGYRNPVDGRTMLFGSTTPKRRRDADDEEGLSASKKRLYRPAGARRLRWSFTLDLGYEDRSSVQGCVDLETDHLATPALPEYIRQMRSLGNIGPAAYDHACIMPSRLSYHYDAFAKLAYTPVTQEGLQLARIRFARLFIPTALACAATHLDDAGDAHLKGWMLSSAVAMIGRFLGTSCKACEHKLLGVATASKSYNYEKLAELGTPTYFVGLALLQMAQRLHIDVDSTTNQDLAVLAFIVMGKLFERVKASPAQADLVSARLAVIVTVMQCDDTARLVESYLIDPASPADRVSASMSSIIDATIRAAASLPRGPHPPRSWRCSAREAVHSAGASIMAVISREVWSSLFTPM